MTSEIFCKNIEAIKDSLPELYAQLQPAIQQYLDNPELPVNGVSYRLKGSRDLEMNLVITENESSSLYHCPDPQTEVDRLFEQAKLSSPQLTFFFGIGLGHALQRFVNTKTRFTYGIFVVEEDPQIFLRALSVYDFSEHLKCTSNNWLVARPLNFAKASLASFMRSHNTVNRSLKIIAQPFALERGAEYYSELGRHFGAARNQATIWSGNSVQDSLNGIKNQLGNLERIANNPSIGAFYSQFQGETCISVAAGPGTNEAWDFIRSAQGRIPIICCDTLLKPMNDRGIVPDIVTALERDSIVADMMRGQKVDPKTSLVAPAILLPDSFEAFQGRHLIYGVTTSYSQSLGIGNLVHLYPGSSAGNLNLAFACFLGFSKIVMIGHNLAFALNSNESHLKGTFDPDREKQKSIAEIEKRATGGKIPTADGLDKVYTIIEYNLFREQIESLIAGNPKSEFINTTAKGAHIEGSRFVPLNEMEKDLETYKFNFWNRFEPLLKEVPKDSVIERLQMLSVKIANAIIDFKSMTVACNEVLEEYPLWKEQIRKAEEASTPVSMEQLNLILDKILKLKISISDGANNASPLIAGVMSPHFSTFERIINELPHTHTSNYELKKDVILKHEELFKSLLRWLPRIEVEIEIAAKRLGQLISPASHLSQVKIEDSKLSPDPR